MGRAFAESVPAARAVFDDADAAVGYDLTALCFEGPLERLSETEVTQPALVAATLACLAGVHGSGLRADYVIGHSVGEYAALVASGAVSGRLPASTFSTHRTPRTLSKRSSPLASAPNPFRIA